MCHPSGGLEDQAGLTGVPQHALHATAWYLGLLGLGLASLLLGRLLSLLPPAWRNVPWLDRKITREHVDDKGDLWRPYQQEKMCLDGQYQKKQFRPQPSCLLVSCRRLVCWLGFVLAITCTSWAAVVVALQWAGLEEKPDREHSQLWEVGLLVNRVIQNQLDILFERLRI